ncbi:MAG: GNAT family N-acetyltransferase [Pseudomonadota bacterium]
MTPQGIEGCVFHQTLTLPEDIHALKHASLGEGYGMVRTLVERYHTGENTFSLPGEALFVARREGALVGIGGLNVDPYFNDPLLGRLRHVYVLPGSRQGGVGRALVARIERAAQGHFRKIQLRSPDAEASAFYLALGYRPVSGSPVVSHGKALTG